MIIVKMNDSTLECNIAASELREMGLTPEAVMRGEGSGEVFMSQINKEVGEQLQYNPDNEVLLMSKNMMSDGSVRIFAIKMTDEDIERTADRIRTAAENMLTLVDADKVEELKLLPVKEKGEALGNLFMGVTEQINHIYITSEDKEAPEPVTVVKNIAKYDLYTVRFLTMDDAIRFSHVVKDYPMKESAFHKLNDEFYLTIRVKNSDDRLILEFRKAAIEYGEELIFDSPQEAHIAESGECIIAKRAVKRLAALFNCSRG